MVDRDFSKTSEAREIMKQIFSDLQPLPFLGKNHCEDSKRIYFLDVSTTSW